MKYKLKGEERSKVITYTIIMAIGAAIYIIAQHVGSIFQFISRLISALSPVLMGIGIAYLLSPPLRHLDKLFTKLLCRKKPHTHLTRTLGVLVCYLIFTTVVVFFIRTVVPQVYASIVSLINILIAFINDNSGRISDILKQVGILTVEGEDFVIAWQGLIERAMNYVSAIFSNALSLSQSVYSLLLNLLVAIAVSIYCLFEKERFSSQVKKLLYSMFSKETCTSVIYWMRRSNLIFSGFISGKIVDSAIMGVLCYLCMRIFKMEYPELISVIFGVTNIVPFFGPIVGGVIGTLLLLIVNPKTALIFAILALVLQQIDGNLIGPYILSDSIGLSSFWVMLAILVGGGLFDFAGMLLGAPVFAIIYAVLKAFTEFRLRRSGLPTDSSIYANAPDSLDDYLKTPENERTHYAPEENPPTANEGLFKRLFKKHKKHGGKQ